MTKGQRFREDAGIAIGAILFVVAVLAILAAAIAAGAGRLYGRNIDGKRHGYGFRDYARNGELVAGAVQMVLFVGMRPYAN